jgi:RNA polymerase sigma factor (sigma-70 family)
MSQNIISIYKRMSFTEQEIVQGILNDDDMVIRYLYRQLFPGIRTMVRSMHNVRLDAEDIFQEGLTRAVLNVKKGSFQGSSSFSTYLNSICRHVCLQELKANHSGYSFAEQVPDVADETDQEQDSIFLMLKLKERLDPLCRQIIDVRFGIGMSRQYEGEQLGHHHNLKFDEIGKVLGIEADNARQRFKRCLEKLRAMITGTPGWEDRS